MNNYTVLGCGRWGSFITWYLDKNGHKTTCWGLDTDPYVVDFFASRTNSYVTLPKSVELTTDLTYAVNKNNTIIISISSQHLASLMEKVSKIDGYKNKRYIICMKGIEESTGRRLSEVISSYGVDKSNIATWVGPGHIQDFTKGIPSLMVVAAYEPKLSLELVNDLKSNLIKYYQSQDMIGTEIGAAAKNVMGIAAGMLDGANMTSLKGALMARGTWEIARLIKACGGNELSAYGLCHLGDYEATLFSPHSHNRKFGELFIQKQKFDKLAEGVQTSKALLMLAEKHNVELPITKAVSEIISEKASLEDSLKILFARPNIKEFE